MLQDFSNKLGLGDPNTCVYKLKNVCDEILTQLDYYFIIHILIICIKFQSHVAHIIYAW